LHWLAFSEEWTCSISQELAKHADIRGSVSQVVDKGYLERFLSEHQDLRELFHYDSYTRVLAVEDPKFMYFLRNLLWSKFVRQAGFVSVKFRSKYDFALSFAGERRDVAQTLSALLRDHEMEVFYDQDEQHRSLGLDVEAYLAPIYRSEARYVVALLSREYPKKVWTKFESEQFKARFGTDSIIPIWFSDAAPGMFDESARVGGITFDPGGDVDEQLQAICSLLIRKVGEQRETEEMAAASADQNEELEEA
jgi:hypothetical protein